MNSQLFQATLSQCQQRVNAQLNQLDFSHCPQRLSDAMSYALLNGGKRIRPFLVYASGRAMQVLESDYLDSAAMAIELIHSYSLVHDDLPAMDDDDLRRGQPTVHKAFDEATAILCGDALLTQAFEQLSTKSYPWSITAINLVAHSAGMVGMVGGQQLDIEATDNPTIKLEQLAVIHRMKTGALIKASILLGALPAKQQAATDYDLLVQFAEQMGVLYQIRDDILDVEQTTEQLGKPQGSDAELNKTTYVSLLGLDRAKQAKVAMAEQALTTLNKLSVDSRQLQLLVNFICDSRS